MKSLAMASNLVKENENSELNWVVNLCLILDETEKLVKYIVIC